MQNTASSLRVCSASKKSARIRDVRNFGAAPTYRIARWAESQASRRSPLIKGSFLIRQGASELEFELQFHAQEMVTAPAWLLPSHAVRPGIRNAHIVTRLRPQANGRSILGVPFFFPVVAPASPCIPQKSLNAELAPPSPPTPANPPMDREISKELEWPRAVSASDDDWRTGFPSQGPAAIPSAPADASFLVLGARRSKVNHKKPVK
jgi:hypothetical protein